MSSRISSWPVRPPADSTDQEVAEAVEEVTENEDLQSQGWPRARPWVDEFRALGMDDEVIQAVLDAPLDEEIAEQVFLRDFEEFRRTGTVQVTPAADVVRSWNN